MNKIRKANKNDISRIAEILIFTKRINYRTIFNNDKVSFGEMQVLPLAENLLKNDTLLNEYWVYDDEFVKGLIHIDGDRVSELFVDTFFEGQGIGSELIEFAISQNVAYVWVLEKNVRAISFYSRHGFTSSGERLLEEGTSEYIIKMVR